MGPVARLGRDWRYFRGLFRTLARVRSISATSANLICDDLEAAVDRWTSRAAISFGGAELTYGEMDALANRFAHWASGQGVARGGVIALLLPNRLEYLPIWYGLSKIGIVVALINNQLTGEGLAHCLRISKATICIADNSTADACRSVRGTVETLGDIWTLGENLDGLRDLRTAVAAMSVSRPAADARRDMTAADTALYIYTSGTTGMPKAARITHMRAQLFMRGFAGATGARDSDRLYVTLPLYHATGGMCAMGAALLNGASVVVRDGFSATHFWREVTDAGATMFVYVGELCRYLAVQPPGVLDRGHRLRLAFGNGLGRDVWATLNERFAIPAVLEFYGSTEGNVSMFNFDGRPGAIGRVPRWMDRIFNVALVKFDVETEAAVRGADGLCVKAGPGDVGECLGRIASDVRTAYSGYLDKAASENKILHDVFRRGDRWFRTGDLMSRDAEGYFFFVDRVGDTFRWKGENVSTTEVAESLMSAPGVEQALVYGVRVGALEGRAGMAALVVDAGFDLAAFARHIAKSLPSYAQPRFLRLTPRLDVTGTFKPRKADLVADGFDPSRIAAPLYALDQDGGYAPLDRDVFARIMSGQTRL